MAMSRRNHAQAMSGQNWTVGWAKRVSAVPTISLGVARRQCGHASALPTLRPQWLIIHRARGQKALRPASGLLPSTALVFG